MSASPQTVYRRPGRAADHPPIAVPSWRTLLRPFVWTSGLVIAVAALLVVLNGVVFPWFLTAGKLDGAQLQLRPGVEAAESGVLFAMWGAPLLLVGLVVRFVRPSWLGLRLPRKIGYVVALLIMQCAVIAASELAVLASLGRLQLIRFDPQLQATFSAPDGRTAYVFTGGLTCAYRVRLAKPYSLTMREVLHITRSSCTEPPPAIRWNDDGSVDLVDPAGAPLLAEPDGSSLFAPWH